MKPFAQKWNRNKKWVYLTIIEKKVMKKSKMSSPKNLLLRVESDSNDKVTT